VYYNALPVEWVSPGNRIPSFQFLAPIDDGAITDFDIINLDAGTTTDYLTYFNANVTSVSLDITKVYSHLGDVSQVLTKGRSYMYVQNVEGMEWFSEVFTVTDLQE
jgi:hypothetical protein